MVNPITLPGYHRFSLLKAAIVVDTNDQTLAEFLNPEDRPAWGRAIGEPSWTDGVEARFRESVMRHARSMSGAVAVVFDPGPGRGERIDLAP